MIKVYQSVLHTEKATGNCFAACIASVLHLDIDDVPWPRCDERDDWSEYWQRICLYLSGLGYMVIEWNTIDTPCPFVGDLCADAESVWIAGGPSKRGNGDHAVVYRGGEMIHDPHPDGTGITDVSIVTYVVPLDPHGCGRCLRKI